MTSTDTPPVAEEAREAAFAAWYQAHVQQEGCEAVTHEAWQAGWATALQWAAGQAEREARTGQKLGHDRIILRGFAIRLRREGGGT